MNRIDIIICKYQQSAFLDDFRVTTVGHDGCSSGGMLCNNTGAAKLVIQEAARIVGDEAMESACRDYMKSRKQGWEPEL